MWKLLLLTLLTSQAFGLDWQGHRGARGLYPENTIGGMKVALRYPVTTLELDVVISKDDKVVVSHEPWMNPVICTGPEGKALAEKKVNLRRLTYQEIRKYDCGSKGHPNFPQQVKVAEGKPLLVDLVKTLESELKKLNRENVSYNVEIKSSLGAEKEGFQPEYKMFSDLVVNTLSDLLPLHKFTIQSFDWRVLRYLHEKDPKIGLVALREEKFEGAESVIKELGFRPAVFSPHWKLLDVGLVMAFQKMGIKVIPWTVNEAQDLKHVRGLGVDGIITDYPDRIEGVTLKECPSGESAFEGKCVKVPRNASATNSNPGWICDQGYQQKRSRCVPIKVPKGAILLEDGKTWVCQEGFVRYRGSCKKDSKKNELFLSL